MREARLDFGRKARTPTAGDRSLGGLLLLLGLVTVALVARPLWTPRVSEGTLIEVSGEVPRPGMYLVPEATIAAAVAAAGGDASELGADPVPEGFQVVVEGGEARLAAPSDPLLVALPVDINQCNSLALEAIPGVGVATASAIIADRDSNGPFYAIEDLIRVRGIGASALAEITPFVSVGEIGPRPAPRKLDLNTATADQLERLPGIGPVTAARIVEDRNRRGPFSDVEALERVKGVGPKTVEKIRSRVVLR